MKRFILMFSLFAVILTGITILKYELSKLDIKVQEAKDLKNKLQYDLGFLKSEWEYLTSPKKIQELSNLHLNYQQVSLVSFNDFLKLLEKLKELK